MVVRWEGLGLHELGATEHGKLRLGLGLLHMLLSHGLLGLAEIHSLHSLLRVASGLIHHGHLLLLLLALGVLRRMRSNLYGHGLRYHPCVYGYLLLLLLHLKHLTVCNLLLVCTAIFV